MTAGRDSAPESQRAMSELCEVYWFPLYSYIRNRVRDASEAQDLTQAFFAELLGKNYVAAAVPERGKFRAFLLTAFKHFLSKEWEKAKTQKRGGKHVLIPLDFDSADSNIKIDPQSGLTPEQIFDQQWVVSLLQQTMQRLSSEYEESGKAAQFEILKTFLVGDRQNQTFVQAAADLKMSEAAARKASSRMRQRYREILREEIAETVSSPDEIDEEVQNLFRIMSL